MVAILAGCSQGNLKEPLVSTTPLQSSAPVGASPQTTVSATSTSSAAALPAGWRWLQGQGIKVAVPAHYSGGRPDNLEAAAAELPELGMDGVGLAGAMGATAELANVVAIDRQTLSKPFVTTMSLAIDGTGKDPELNKYLSKAVKELAGAWTIQKSEQITLTNRKFALVRATALQAKTPVTLFAYLTPHRGKFCLLLFTVASADADRQAGDFQKIAASLQSGN
jgi:hypothetical protein